MSLKFNNTEVTRLFFNGEEQKSLRYNGVGYFGKRFTLAQSASTGVTLSVNRTSSPNQRAATGIVSTGNTIYYGDVITIGITANANYSNPKLYVDVGDGNGPVQRTSPYTFTVGNNVTYYGSATATGAGTWETVWTGSQTFTGSGCFTVPGLEAGGSVQITATVSFEDFYMDENETIYPGTEFSASINRKALPTTVHGNMSSVDFSRNGNQIVFTFNEGWESSKGFVLCETPTEINITEVRRKA